MALEIHFETKKCMEKELCSMEYVLKQSSCVDNEKAEICFQNKLYQLISCIVPFCGICRSYATYKKRIQSV